MAEFIKIDAQHVRHSSGYEVYSAGRYYVGFEEQGDVFRVAVELGTSLVTNKFHQTIYVNKIYDKGLNRRIALSPVKRRQIIKKIVAALHFLDDCEIELNEEE